MTDRDLRTREREMLTAPGDEEAQSRDLAARLRAGRLDAKCLERAAFFGHIPARIVLGGTGAWCGGSTHNGTGAKGCPRQSHHHHDDGCLRDGPDENRWIRIAAGFGWRVAARAAYAMAALALRVVEDDRLQGFAPSQPPGYGPAPLHPQEAAAEIERARRGLLLACRWITHDNRHYPSEHAPLPAGLEAETRLAFGLPDGWAAYDAWEAREGWHLCALALAARPLDLPFDPNPGRVRATDRDYLTYQLRAANFAVNRNVRYVTSRRSLMSAAEEHLVPWLLAGAPNE